MQRGRKVSHFRLIASNGSRIKTTCLITPRHYEAIKYYDDDNGGGGDDDNDDDDDDGDDNNDAGDDKYDDDNDCCCCCCFIYRGRGGDLLLDSFLFIFL